LPKVPGLITRYYVLNGNPVDGQVGRVLSGTAFGGELFSADRVFSQDTQSLPCRGGTRVHSTTWRWEKAERGHSPAFKKGQRFRAGIEGRISVLFRGRGMKRCLAEGRERFELLVGAAVLANNLLVIAERLIKHKRHRTAA
jgi:IS5 family transposase